MAAWMRKGQSFTGEESAELYLHGGVLNLQQILRRVISAGARLAEPGEFSRRAFLNGKLDLTKAEAIASIISAKNEASLKIARQHLRGKLNQTIEELTSELLQLSAATESWIDFPEEFDPQIDREVALLLERLKKIIKIVEKLKDSYQTGKKLKESWKIAIVGKPNAGKSSLFNQLCGEERAIVTDIPGTTRDPIQAEIALGGLSFSLLDTAGIRNLQDQKDPHSKIEAEGIRRSLQTLENAHLIIAVLDNSRPLSDEDRQILDKCSNLPTILVFNKSDLPTKLDREKLQPIQPIAALPTSCRTGTGIDELKKQIKEYLEKQTPTDELIITHERHYQALKKAHQALKKALSEGIELGPEFMAEDLRTARNELSQIIGTITTEDILEQIFSNFCIGK